MMLPRVLVALVLSASAALAQGRLAEVHVSGTARGEAAVLTAAGLKIGQPITEKDLDAACQRLLDSGFFRGASYKYVAKPAKGGLNYSVSFDVNDETTLVSVILDIPNADQEQLWSKFKAADPLLDRQMPDTDGAQHYYQQALEKLLGESGKPQSLKVKREADLGKGRMAVVFRPANLPKLRQIAFEGNHVFNAAMLEKIIHPVAIGEDYSEREFRLIVESNLTPMYEEKGYLKVSFPKIVAVPVGDGMLAAVTIQEGREWRIGDLLLSGDNLPADRMLRASKCHRGDVANWKQVLVSLDEMKQVLRSDGYLSASAKPSRIFHDESGDVDLQIAVQRGPRFYFGTLELQGLSAKDNEKAMEMWELRPGAPMDGVYLDDYVRSVFSAVRAKSQVNRNITVRQPGNLVDVVLKF
jgi:outer membrane protein assembly factor BamA